MQHYTLYGALEKGANLNFVLRTFLTFSGVLIKTRAAHLLARDTIPEISQAARYLDEAVTEYLAGNPLGAEELNGHSKGAVEKSSYGH